MQTETQQELLNVLDRIQLPDHIRQDWTETLVVVAQTPINIQDINDDFNRELAFYETALDAVKYAVTEFKQNDVKYDRPLDFLAEMIKTDKHMAKVKRNLLFEQKKIKAAQENKTNRLYKKFAKSLQSEKQKQFAQEKRHMMETIETIKKSNVSDKKQAVDEAFTQAVKKRDQKKRKNQSKRSKNTKKKRRK